MLPKDAPWAAGLKGCPGAVGDVSPENGKEAQAQECLSWHEVTTGW